MTELLRQTRCFADIAGVARIEKLPSAQQEDYEN
jgi:hypothetical protein